MNLKSLLLISEVNINLDVDFIYCNGVYFCNFGGDFIGSEIGIIIFKWEI